MKLELPKIKANNKTGGCNNKNSVTVAKSENLFCWFVFQAVDVIAGVMFLFSTFYMFHQIMLYILWYLLLIIAHTHSQNQ